MRVLEEILSHQPVPMWYKVLMVVIICVLCYNSYIFESNIAYGENVTNLCTEKYPIVASTCINNNNNTYIERTSADGRKFSDCCTEIIHSSRVYAGYLTWNHSTYKSNYNDKVNTILILNHFSNPYKEPIDNKTQD